MKTRLFSTSFIIILISSSLFFSCNKNEPEPEPAACYNSNNRIIKLSEIISFKNCSSNYDRAEWDFGDGTSSTLSEPSHGYEKKGIFDVALTVFKGDKRNKITKSVASGLTPLIICDINLSNWSFPSKYDNIEIAPRLISQYENIYMQSTDIETSGSTTFDYYTSGVPTNPDWPYYIKIRFIGQYSKVTGPGQTTCCFFEPIDSVITKSIDVFTGPVLPQETLKLNLGTVSYKVRPIQFN